MEKRGSGILLHISSLPSDFGIGDMGEAAYKFVDFLAQAKQKYWQVLPFNPTSLINGSSPYSSVSAFATNTLLISPELLCKDGFLTSGEIDSSSQNGSRAVDYENVLELKAKLFAIAFERFEKLKDKAGFNNFCSENKYWLDDFAAFIAFKEHFQDCIWTDWPKEIRDRDKKSMNELKEQLTRQIKKEKFLQYLFLKQWIGLKNYCNQKGVQVIGDIPIYVTYDSVDVWKNPEIFKLDENKNPVYVAGVPPDYFSKTGQLWGNPVYDWDVLAENNYSWWMQRINHNLKLFDLIRIDHFRGFVDYWQVKNAEKTAINGEWQKAPAKEFFKALLKEFPELPLIAEDLGIITDEVRETMKYFGFPGMKIVMFAFGEDDPEHPYLPQNFATNCVAYTGTHDNNTARGWFEQETTPEDRKRLSDCLGKETNADKLHWDLIELLMKSAAHTVIFPLQDVFGLPQADRMNIPGTVGNNWKWRFKPEQITPQVTVQLAKMTEQYSRT
ncbi:MAG: 4-alpha-glucanotransferase [Candidatus Omnitrophota bacterium]